MSVFCVFSIIIATVLVISYTIRNGLGRSVLLVYQVDDYFDHHVFLFRAAFVRLPSI